jgi:hypothetical protein
MSEPTQATVDVEALAERLAAPFDPAEVKWKPQAVSGDKKRAMACGYVDARVVQDRLDEVFTVAGWQDRYRELANGSVVCELQVKVGDDWICKTDVGSQSEQPDDGDKLKAAFSDALKRAAVKLGIGRYLYRLPSQWVDYDAEKRRFARTPDLPARARPKSAASPAPAASAEQQQEVAAMLKATGSEWGLFAAAYCIGRMGELPAMHVENAKRRIGNGEFKKAA